MRLSPKPFLLSLILLFFACGYGSAEPLSATTMREVISADEIGLTDGRVIHLQGIHCCLDTSDGMALIAKKFLQQIVDGKKRLFENAVIDRYGRRNAPVYAVTDDGEKIWLQGAMLTAGMAFVYSPVGD